MTHSSLTCHLFSTLHWISMDNLLQIVSFYKSVFTIIHATCCPRQNLNWCEKGVSILFWKVCKKVSQYSLAVPPIHIPNSHYWHDYELGETARKILTDLFQIFQNIYSHSASTNCNVVLKKTKKNSMYRECMQTFVKMNFLLSGGA